MFYRLAFIYLAVAAVGCRPNYAQLLSIAEIDTTTATEKGHVAAGAYIDSYFGYNLSNSSATQLPYTVSSSRNNSVSINLAYIDLRYRSKHLRARFVPGVGTYINDNYKNEPGTLKNLVEANMGVLLSSSRNIWLDVGVLGSPYTNETAISKDQLMYTRSFAPENVPYYLAGARLSIPLSETVQASVYLLNGWQVIDDNNKGKSLGTQLQYKPSGRWTFNWNTYVGDERSAERPDFRTRYFSEVHAIFQPSSKFDATSCFYWGQQQTTAQSRRWGQFNVIGRYHFTHQLSLSGRVEYFHDPDNVFIQPVTAATNRFQAYSSGVCLNYAIGLHALARFEAKQYFSSDKVFATENGSSSTNTLLVASLAAWF